MTLKEHNDRMDALFERYHTLPAWLPWATIAIILSTGTACAFILGAK